MGEGDRAARMKAGKVGKLETEGKKMLGEGKGKMYWTVFSFFFVIYKKKFIRKLQGQKGPWDLGERRVKVGSLGGGRGRGKCTGAGFLGE